MELVENLGDVARDAGVGAVAAICLGLGFLIALHYERHQRSAIFFAALLAVFAIVVPISYPKTDLEKRLQRLEGLTKSVHEVPSNANYSY